MQIRRATARRIRRLSNTVRSRKSESSPSEIENRRKSTGQASALLTTYWNWLLRANPRDAFRPETSIPRVHNHKE